MAEGAGTAYRAGVTEHGARVPSSTLNHSLRNSRSRLMKPAKESDASNMAGSWATRICSHRCRMATAAAPA